MTAPAHSGVGRFSLTAAAAGAGYYGESSRWFHRHTVPPDPPRASPCPSPSCAPPNTLGLTPVSGQLSDRHAAYQRVRLAPERAQQLLTATLELHDRRDGRGETVAKLAVDVKDFLHSDADAPVPPSLRQALRVLNTPELEECAARVTSGVARMAAATSGGGVDGGRREGGDEDGGDGPATSSLDAVLDRVLDPGTGG